MDSDAELNVQARPVVTSQLRGAVPFTLDSSAELNVEARTLVTSQLRGVIPLTLNSDIELDVLEEIIAEEKCGILRDKTDEAVFAMMRRGMGLASFDDRVIPRVFSEVQKKRINKKELDFPAIVFSRVSENRISALDGHQIIAVSYEIDIRSKEYNEAKRIDEFVIDVLSKQSIVTRIESIVPRLDDEIATNDIHLRLRVIDVCPCYETLKLPRLVYYLCCEIPLTLDKQAELTSLPTT